MTPIIDKKHINKASELLTKMTLSEKVAQISGVSNPGILKSFAEGGIIPEEGFGAVFCRTLSDEEIKIIVSRAKNETRLGIPPLTFEESLHGLYREYSTVFPQSIGMASTFSPSLVENAAEVIGKEARKAGIRQVLAPNIDLSRDPRWGRVEENYGEDPYLTAVMGSAYIRGIQKNGVAATAKHYIAHGSPEGGLNTSPVHIGERELYENMLEPFEAAVKNGVLSVMPGYSEFDGTPLHTSRKLLTVLLREKLGFDGYTISDFGALPMIHIVHKVCASYLEAGKLALKAGVDMEATAHDCYGNELLEALENGNIPVCDLDRAVLHILTVKYALGLFDDEEPVESEYHSASSRALSVRAARESMVLLKNNGILPLDESFRKIVITGPNADVLQFGDYSHKKWEQRCSSLKKILSERFGDRIEYYPGSHIASSDPSLADTVKAAEDADAVIVVLGDSSMCLGGVGWGEDNIESAVTCGEGFDSSSLLLPEAQRQLLREIHKAGKPVILVLQNGRPYCIGEEANLSDAVLEAWYPGEAGGEAIADILFGRTSPSGRLPISFPQTVGHVPCFYNYKISARGFYNKPGSPEKNGRDYVFSSPAPLFPFGFGLSYTTFGYSDLNVKVTGRDTAEVSVRVKNTGTMEAMESVLLYVSAKYCPVTPFVKRLRAFDKVSLKPGEEATVSFSLGKDDFSYVNDDMEKETGSGLFSVEVGNLTCEFEL